MSAMNNNQAEHMAHTLHSNNDLRTKTEPKDFA